MGGLEAEENVWSMFNQWALVAVWIVVYGGFALFLPYYRKSKIKPTGVYLAFIVAFAVEMYGVPFGMFLVAALTGYWLPEGVLWGHTLSFLVGARLYWVGMALDLAGLALAFVGWRQIHRDYWSKEAGTGKLVTDGLYRYVRHPQYTGFFLITLGVVIAWATLPLLVLWAVLMVVYVRLAKSEERDMEAEFGQAYLDYRARTGMFWPRLNVLFGHRARVAAAAH